MADGIRVEWMDGRTETYDGSARIHDGVLVITEEYGVSGGVKNRVFIPLVNLRIWGTGRA